MKSEHRARVSRGAFSAGQIIVVDWRGDGLPKEANKSRPCVVVEDSVLFDPTYPNVIVVPLADDDEYVVAALSVEIRPTAENGCKKTCYAMGHAVVTASKRRISKVTDARVTGDELRAIRKCIAESLGITR